MCDASPSWEMSGSIIVGESSSSQVVEIRPWTAEEYERWQRTGFPPGSGWEPPADSH
jgi:hypothetical protein